MVDQTLALQIRNPDFDYGRVLQTGAQLQTMDTNNKLGQLRLSDAQAQKQALADHAATGNIDALKAHPDLYGKVLENRGAAEQQNDARNMRDLQQLRAIPYEQRRQIWPQMLDRARQENRVPSLMHQNLRNQDPSDDVIDRMLQGYRKAPTDLETAHADLYRAQAAATRQKPSGEFDLGPGQTRYRSVPDSSAPGGVRAVPVASGGPEKPPSGYEPDPNQQGRLRPVAGGPADAVPGDKAAAFALVRNAIKDMGRLKEVYIGNPDAKKPAALGPFYDVTAYPAYYGSFGEVGSGERLMYSGVEGMLRLQSGAAAPEPEIRREMRKYMPSPTDSAKTRQDKLELFDRNLRSAMEVAAKGVTASGLMNEIGGVQSKGFQERAPTAQDNAPGSVRSGPSSTGQIPPDAVRLLKQVMDSGGTTAEEKAMVRKHFEDKYGVKADQFLMQR